ncbi:MAG: hypothetical protein M3177_06405 [Pseudomonadota bacterium]|nr:hypothetical protein [Pseudomonadota bacterium]
MTPTSIRLFERLFLGSLVLGVAQAALGWPALKERGSPAEILALLGLSLFILGALTLLVSRGRSRPAKWLLTLLLLIGLPSVLVSFLRGTLIGSPLLALVQAALQAGAVALLFTGSARAWLAQSDSA